MAASLATSSKASVGLGKFLCLFTFASSILSPSCVLCCLSACTSRIAVSVSSSSNTTLCAVTVLTGKARRRAAAAREADRWHKPKETGRGRS